MRYSPSFSVMVAACSGTVGSSYTATIRAGKRRGEIVTDPKEINRFRDAQNSIQIQIVVIESHVPHGLIRVHQGLGSTTESVPKN